MLDLWLAFIQMIVGVSVVWKTNKMKTASLSWVYAFVFPRAIIPRLTTKPLRGGTGYEIDEP